MTQRQRRAALDRADAKICAERFALDEGLCQERDCYAEGEKPHHIIPKRSGGTTHQYVLSEVVTLCRMHHGWIHDAGREVGLKDGRVIDQHGIVEGA